jgi:hypothetical protein
MTTDLIRVSLVSFTDFVCTVGPRRAAVVAEKRRQYEEAKTFVADYYGPFDRAFRKGLADGDLAARLEDAAAKATLKGQAESLRALNAGVPKLLKGARVERVLDVPDLAPWTRGGLALTVTPTVAVELRGGAQELWFLHRKEPVLVQATADAPLVVVREALAAAGSSLVPRVIDVRRGGRFGLRARRNERHLRASVEADADTFMRFWIGAGRKAA